MNPQEHNMAVLGQILKLIPKKLIEKAYVDFDHLYHLNQRGVTWVTRAKENISYEVMGQQLSEEEIQQAKHMRKNNNFMGQQPIVLSDCRIKMTANSLEKYLQELRLVSACVLINGKSCAMNFITNNFDWSAYSICDLYLARWGIEVFFKEIKQTLQLADFLGTSENAIKWQLLRLALLPAENKPLPPQNGEQLLFDFE